MNIKSRYYLIVIALILGMCTACSGDDFDIPGHGSKDGLTLSVPVSGQFTSRATDATVDELAYNSLTFIAYPKDGSKPYVEYLTPSTGTLTVDPTFRSYNLGLPRGTYRFYLLANFMPSGTAVPQTEQALLEAEGSAVYAVPDGYTCGLPVTGLPMSAAHSDFFLQDENGSQALPGDADGYYYYDGQGGSLYAVLTFMFAKITVNASDAAGETATMTDIEVHNLSERVPAFRVDGFDYGTESGPIALGETTSAVFYVPERYVAADAPESQTSVSFKIGDSEIRLPLGQTVDQEAGNKYELPGEDSYRFIARGMHYSYKLVTRDNIILEVEDWTPEEIAAANASVFLHVESQVYPIASGEKTAIWFDSSAKDVKIESPKFDGISLYDYSIDPNQDTIRVWVNDTIPSSRFNEIKESIQNDEGKYDYFHIVAGNIHKRIQVTPLKLEYFLDVDPESMSIIVSLRVASGEYDGTLPVSIHTNYPKVKVTPGDGWNSLPTDAPDALQLINPFGLPVGGESEADVVNGYADYKVAFKGLNSSYNVWKDDRTLTFTVTGLDDSGQEMETVPVTVSIVPNILNYKIHFKPLLENWQSPHIYVYQCLEFPADYTPELALQPIGYQVISSEVEINYYAALEYSFTGAMAFRGWDYPGNYSLLYNSDGTPKTLSLSRAEGFYYFDDKGINDSWSAEYRNTTRYNFKMDFAAAHREEINNGECSLCTSSPNLLWPGIGMKKEENGWYEFELTGIATPGKALIMFADGHTANKVVLRFPGASAPGVPLFDYPSKEGWILYDGIVGDRIYNQFYPYNPEEQSIEYRIYWPKSTGMKQFYAWFDGKADPSWVDHVWSGGQFTGEAEDYYYCDFKTCVYDAKIGIQFHTGNSSLPPIFTTLSVFVPMNVGGKNIRCAFFEPKNNSMNSGSPLNLPTYRIYWPQSMDRPQFYSWLWGTETMIGPAWNEGLAYNVKNGFYYYDFKTTYSNVEIGVIFHRDGNKTDDLSTRLSTFRDIDGIKCAYYTNENSSSFYPGLPTFTKGNKYRIYWLKESGARYLNMWLVSTVGRPNEGVTGWPPAECTGETDRYYYFDFNFDQDLNPAEWRFCWYLYLTSNGSSPVELAGNPYNSTWFLNQFLYDSSVDRNCAALKGFTSSSELVSGAPVNQ